MTKGLKDTIASKKVEETKKILKKGQDIQSWFSEKWKKLIACMYL